MVGSLWKSRGFAALAGALVMLVGCDAPEGLGVFRPAAPTVIPGSTIEVGVTATGEARAKIYLDGDAPYELGNGVAGTRAYVYDAAGNVLRRPSARYSNEQNFIILTGLRANKLYGVKLVGVSNIGFETSADQATYGWDDDDDPSTNDVGIIFETPSKKEDEEPPTSVDPPDVTWQGDGVGLTWLPGEDFDVYGYIIERGTSEIGPFVSITPRPIMDAGTISPIVGLISTPTLRDPTATAAGATYFYRVVVVDLSGNLSAPSDVSGGVVVR